MGKKRKAGRAIGHDDSADRPEQTKFAPDEDFAGSEDEFYRGKDKILLQEGPEAKRRRRLQDTSAFIS